MDEGTEQKAGVKYSVKALHQGDIRPVAPLTDDTAIAFAVERAQMVRGELRALDQELASKLAALKKDERETRHRLDRLRRAVSRDRSKYARAKANGARHPFLCMIWEMLRFWDSPDNQQLVVEIQENIHRLNKSAEERKNGIMEDYLCRRKQILDRNGGICLAQASAWS